MSADKPGFRAALKIMHDLVVKNEALQEENERLKEERNRGGLVERNKYLPLLAEQSKRIAELEEFARDVRDNWDCDSGANGAHPHYCRACRAKALHPKVV